MCLSNFVLFFFQLFISIYSYWSTSLQNCTRCKAGYYGYAYQTLCYGVYGSPGKTFQAASNHCKSINATLVYLDTSNLFNFFKSIMPSFGAPPRLFWAK